MHQHLTIAIFLSVSLLGSREQFFGQKEWNPMFNRRRCPPQLERTVFKCIRQYLIEVPDYIHSQTKILDLSSNQLTVLHENNFANLYHLVRLVLDDNKIWKITQNTFLKLTKLTELSLRYNHLSIDISNSITAKILSPLSSLLRLDLSHNPLEIIPDDLFVNSSTINCLILNSVGSPVKIFPKAFYPLPKLEFLSLEGNQLSTISENLFKSQNQLIIYNILLANNSWNCNCSLKWLRIALENVPQTNQLNYYFNPTTTSQKKHIPSCSTPLQWKGFPLSQVPLNNFQCKTEVIVPHTNITAIVGSETSLLCQFYFANNENSTITWYHNNRRITPSWRIQQFTYQTVNVTSMLNISTINYGDSGMYQCQIQTQREYVKEAIYLTVIRSEEAVVSGIRIIFAIGTVLASIIIVVVVILAVIYLIKHRTMFCSASSKFDPVFHSKSNSRKIREQSNQPEPNIQSLGLNTPQKESSLALLRCRGKEYLSLPTAHDKYRNQPHILQSKPAFQCAHNHPFVLNQNSRLLRNYSYDDTINLEKCDHCISSDNCTTIDSFSKCPIHNAKTHLLNHHTSIDEENQQRPTNTLLNINCPLHGYKSDNLFYYELSNLYK